MDGEELNEFTDEQLMELDQVVENLPKNEHNSPMRTEKTCNENALNRGRASSFDGNQNRSHMGLIDVFFVSTNAKRFGKFTNTQFDSIDDEDELLTLEQQNVLAKNHQTDTDANASEKQRKLHKNIITAEQHELAAALFDDEDDYHEPSLDHLDCLLSRFKHDRFREKQWEIIRAVMIEKRDVCAVMATGYGKSLCFQVIVLHSDFYFLALSLPYQ